MSNGKQKGIMVCGFIGKIDNFLSFLGVNKQKLFHTSYLVGTNGVGAISKYYTSRYDFHGQDVTVYSIEDSNTEGTEYDQLQEECLCVVVLLDSTYLKKHIESLKELNRPLVIISSPLGLKEIGEYVKDYQQTVLLVEDISTYKKMEKCIKFIENTSKGVFNVTESYSFDSK